MQRFSKQVFCGLLMSGFIGCSDAAAPTTNERTITSSGHGEVSVPQTIATFQLLINDNAKTAKEAQLAVRKDADNLLKALRTANLLSIETNNISVNPVFSYANNTQSITGYSASYGVKVRTKIEDSGKVIDLAIDNGVNSLDSPILSANPEDLKKAQIEAIKLASLDAKKQADAALTALGYKATIVKQINVQSNDNTPPMRPKFALMSSSTNSAPATQVQADQEVVNATVNLTVGY